MNWPPGGGWTGPPDVPVNSLYGIRLAIVSMRMATWQDWIAIGLALGMVGLIALLHRSLRQVRRDENT